MAASIPPGIAPRVGSLVRMLASPADGEVLNAARALGRVLRGAGLDVNDLADLVEHPPGPVVITRDAATTPRRGPKARAASPGSVELKPARRRQVDALSEASARSDLSSWKSEFVASVITTLRGSRPRLSARQFEIVERTLSKIGGDAWA